MKHVFFLIAFSLVCNLSAQEYKTYKKVNDSTFVETRSYEVEEQTDLSQSQVLSNIFREMDRWADIENKHFNNMLTAQRVFGALNRDQRALIPDTTYFQYNAFRDTIYSYPELQRDEFNAIVYDSEVRVGDSTYEAQLFRNAGGAQVLRIAETASNHSARFVESDKVIRVGANEPLPGLNGFCNLSFIRETPNARVYFGLIENQVVRLIIRKR